MSRSGDLIAHPDISLVLQRRNLAHLAQVKGAFQVVGRPRPRAMLAYNLEGKRVISSNALIPILEWVVIVERPVEEAYEPLYASMLRTSAFFWLASVWRCWRACFWGDGWFVRFRRFARSGTNRQAVI